MQCGAERHRRHYGAAGIAKRVEHICGEHKTADGAGVHLHIMLNPVFLESHQARTDYSAGLDGAPGNFTRCS